MITLVLGRSTVAEIIGENKIKSFVAALENEFAKFPEQINSIYQHVVETF